MIFLSYSHVDAAWMERVSNHLHVLVDSSSLRTWDDRGIRPGKEWLPEIEKALEQARVAVLLVSIEFLNSPFIRGTELPRLLERRNREGLRVIPLLVRPCAWQKVPWLAPLQILPRGAQPLSGMAPNEYESVLAQLAEEVASELALDPPLKVSPAISPTGGNPEQQALLSVEIERELLATSARLDAASCSLMAVDRDSGGKYLHIRWAYGVNSDRIRDLRLESDQGIRGLVFTRNIPHVTNDLPTDSAFSPAVARKADLTPQSMVTVPVARRGNVLGVAQFVNKASGRFTDADRDLAMAFADRIAPILEKVIEPPPEGPYEGVRECSVLFTDITNYGLVANTHDLPITTKFLNEYLTLVCNAALRRRFWIDKFLGDGVMVVVNAPRARPDFALDSIRLVLEIEAEMQRLVAQWVRFGVAPVSQLKSRIGIATGHVYLGNIGHPEVHWYTAIGPSVNLAWRLLELGARDDDCIMICPRTHELAAGRVRAERVSVGYRDASTEPGFGYRVRELLAH